MTPRFEFGATTGLISPVRFVSSPNHDERPVNLPVDVLVIHSISLPCGSYRNDYVEQLFTNQLDCDAHPDFAKLKNKKVSAHFFIKRDGTLIQFVLTHRRAWHAGKSIFRKRPNVNDFSIGIELEGVGIERKDCDYEQFEDAQYAMLSDLTTFLITHYPAIKRAHIVAHSDIAPGRKTDPGPYFDWSRFINSLAIEGFHSTIA